MWIPEQGCIASARNGITSLRLVAVLIQMLLMAQVMQLQPLQDLMGRRLTKRLLC